MYLLRQENVLPIPQTTQPNRRKHFNTTRPANYLCNQDAMATWQNFHKNDTKISNSMASKYMRIDQRPMVTARVVLILGTS